MDHDCTHNILYYGWPPNHSLDSKCELDHAPQGTSRKEYLDIRHSIAITGSCPFEGQDGVSDADNDKYIADLAEIFATLRARNRPN